MNEASGNLFAAARTELALLLAKLEGDTKFLGRIDAAAELLYTQLSAEGTLYTAGNGGSAAEAQHLSAEFIGRYRRERPPYPAMALTAESSAMTAIGNDYAYDQVFARQIAARGSPRDVLIALTTSGNSPNIVAAVKAAKEKGVPTVCLLGKGGGAVAGMADIDIIVPADATARIQEVHLLIIHALCEAFDTRLLGPG